MKVLEEGRDWNLEKRCTGYGNGGGGCNALLGIALDDIYQTYRGDYIEITEICYTFKCPVCGVETDLETYEVPEVVKKKLMEQYWQRRGR